VDVSAAELPIMDGSAAPFVFLIKSAGIKEQHALKKYVRIKQAVKVTEGDKFAELIPYKGFQVSCAIDFDHPVLQASPQDVTFDFSGAAYEKEVSRARTFGFLAQYEAIRKQNQGLGASLDNALVVDEFRVLNQDGLRYPDEFVKHKILDVIGDLYLLGHSVIGAFRGYKPGHTLNSQLLKALLAQEDAFEIVTIKEEPELESIRFLTPSFEPVLG
jgi:UDP-3-O-[3-hydroxymyristoyl] N-acetylglucosamine deacetylase